MHLRWGVCSFYKSFPRCQLGYRAIALPGRGTAPLHAFPAGSGHRQCQGCSFPARRVRGRTERVVAARCAARCSACRPRPLSPAPKPGEGDGGGGAGGRAAPQARELTGSVFLFAQQGTRCPYPLPPLPQTERGYRVLQRPHHPTPFPPPPWVGEGMREGWGPPLPPAGEGGRGVRGVGGRMRQANNLAPKGGHHHGTPV